MVPFRILCGPRLFHYIHFQHGAYKPDSSFCVAIYCYGDVYLYNAVCDAHIGVPSNCIVPTEENRISNSITSNENLTPPIHPLWIAKEKNAGVVMAIWQFSRVVSVLTLLFGAHGNTATHRSRFHEQNCARNSSFVVHACVYAQNELVLTKNYSMKGSKAFCV